MNEETIKRYSLAEIALLLIFVMGLSLAYVLVKIRHRIELSEPIPLAGSGAAVSMPQNKGWEYETNWRYESDNIMALVAQQQIQGSPQPKASIRWRYAICSPASSAEDILHQRARQSGSELGLIETLPGSVTMYYAMIAPPGHSRNAFYLGVVPLDYGRHLELHVVTYQRFDFSYAEDLMRALSTGIRYEPPSRLKAGRELVRDFWDAASPLGKKPEKAFVLKDTENRPLGYGYFQYSTIGSDSEKRVQISSRLYEHQRSRIDSTLWFDDDERRYSWTTTIQQARAQVPQKYTLVQETDGTVSITTNDGEDKQFTSQALLLPELLLPDCASFMLDGENNSLIVDVISPTGYVVPTVMERKDAQEAIARSEQTEFVVKIDFLNNLNSFEELYFDENKRFIGRFERQPRQRRLWDLTTAEQLEQLYGESFRPVNDDMVFLFSK